MLKIFSWLFLLLISPVDVLFSQADSLLHFLAVYNHMDSTRLNALNKLSQNLGDDPEKSILYANEAINLANKLGLKNKEAEAYRNRGLLLYEVEDGIDSTIADFDKAIRLFTETGDVKNVAITVNKIGIAHNGIGEYKTAIQYHQKALKYFSQLKDTIWTANAINSIGVNYYQLNDYAKALDQYFSSLRWHEQAKNLAGQAITLGNIGLVYSKVSQSSKAIEYFQKSIKIYEKTGNEDGVARGLDHIGSAYDDMGEYDRSLEYYLKALAIFRRIGKNAFVAGCLTNIGIVQNDLRHYKLALENFEEALSMYRKDKDNKHVAITLTSMADVYRMAPVDELPQVISNQSKFLIAEKYYKESLLAGKDEEGFESINATNYNGLALALESQSKFKEAFYAFKQYASLKDSIFSDESKDEISKRELQYDFEKKEAVAAAIYKQEKALQQSEIKRQRLLKNSIIAGSGLILAAGIGLFVFYKRSRDAAIKSSEAEFKATLANTEMKALRAQMNPHFIFNSLNSIADYIDRQDAETASLYTTRFAKLMRMILENSEKQNVPLEDDLKALELYMQLEAKRLHDKFSYEIKVEDTIDPAETVIPPLLLQPFVENSIWHGIAKKDGPGKITIQVKREGDMINCIIEDDGLGRRYAEQAVYPSPGRKHKSMGMKITKSRIDIVNRQRNSEASVKLTDLAKGLRVELRLPYELSF